MEQMRTAVRRLGIRIKDDLKNSRALRNAQALALQTASSLSPDPVTAQLRAVTAFQRSESPQLWKWLGAARENHEEAASDTSPPPSPSTARYRSYLTQQSQLTRSIILKAPGGHGERGVLMVQFEYNWYRLLNGLGNLEALTKEYDILWGTSWSATDYLLLKSILSKTTGEVYVLPSHASEAAKLSAFHPRIQCPPVLSACDWVNPIFFTPKPHAERSTDILMVANWAPFKRHFELFSALREMPADLRVTLIGQTEAQYTAEHIRQMMRMYRVPQQVTLLESLPIDEVTRHQCDSKVALILSRREGSCVAAVEALFAGAALGMRRGAHVGSVQYINDKTGALISGTQTATDLMALLERSATLRPHEWAARNISCHVSLGKLNTFLRERAAARNLPWSGDLAPFHWRPYPTYSEPADLSRLQPTYDDLHRRFPEVFSHDLGTTSRR
jgi:glycosyltransferase involved in cell wall biosynthesis